MHIVSWAQVFFSSSELFYWFLWKPGPTVPGSGGVVVPICPEFGRETPSIFAFQRAFAVSFYQVIKSSLLYFLSTLLYPALKFAFSYQHDYLVFIL